MRPPELPEPPARPRICRDALQLPAELIASALTMEPAAAYRDVEDWPTCLLQEHDEGAHHGLVASIRGDDAVWVVWGAGMDPHLQQVLDCPGEGEDGPCTLFDRHPGLHSFELYDELMEKARIVADLLWPAPLLPGA